jgi:hypothetical protein
VFKLLHVRDTLVPVSPTQLAERLGRAGLADTDVRVGGRSFRFRARKAHASQLENGADAKRGSD